MNTPRQQVCRICMAAGLMLTVYLSTLAPACRAEVSEKHRQAVQNVMSRLLAKAKRPEGYDAWPPRLVILESDQMRAFASFDMKVLQESDLKKKVPMITVSTGLIDFLGADEDRLALVLGHEIGHHVRGHLLKSLNSILNKEKKLPKFAELPFGREAEYEADAYGMHLLLSAGYRFKQSQEAFTRLRDKREYTSFEEATKDHPSWANRLAAMQTDEAKQKFWKATSAFENGVFFLLTEQYINAERCFRQVTREFPGCYEGWANLGYARLMMYCDALEAKDLQGFDLGHLVVGGFYRRADSIVRGPDEDLWFDAVGALREALRLKPDLVLPKANLAVAYLVRPAGKDVGQATRLFTEVAAALRDEKTAKSLHPLVRASLLVNAGVAALSAGNSGEAQKIFDEVADSELFKNRPARNSASSPVQYALEFNRALASAASPDDASQKEAFQSFEHYLTGTPSAVAWWSIAYDKYAAVAKKLGVEAKSKETLQRGEAKVWRTITAVQVGDDMRVGLSAPVSEVKASLGDPDSAVPVIAGTNLKRYSYTKQRVTLLATRRVVAIVLDDPQGPTLELRRSGLSTEPVTLRVGMSREELEKAAGGDRPIGYLLDNDISSGYRFYHEIGLAVKIRGGKVVEFVVAPLPRGE